MTPVSAIHAGKTGNGTFVRDGNQFFGRYESVPRYGWGVIVEKPVSVLRQSLWAVEKHVWLLWLLFLTLGLGLSASMAWLYSQLETGHSVHESFYRHVLHGRIRRVLQASEPRVGKGFGV